MGIIHNGTKHIFTKPEVKKLKVLIAVQTVTDCVVNNMIHLFQDKFHQYQYHYIFAYTSVDIGEELYYRRGIQRRNFAVLLKWNLKRVLFQHT